MTQRVHELKPGTRFKILQRIYVLYSCSNCAALVEEETPAREVTIGDATFTAPGGRRFHIAPTAEVDEVLGTVPLKERTTARVFVNEVDEARKAIARQERKERARRREEEAKAS